MESMTQKKSERTGFSPAVSGIWFFRIAMVLLILSLISCYLVSGLYARYTSTGSGSDSGRVAAFIFNVNDTASAKKFVDIGTIEKPGDQVEYAFTVTNASGSKVCETKMAYSFQTSADGSMPLIYAVTDSKGTEVLSGTLINAASFPVESTSSADAVTDFPAGVERTDNYKLTIRWPNEDAYAEYASADYANAASGGVFELAFTAWQVD